MVEKLKRNYRKFDALLRRKPGYSVLFTVTILIITQMIINLLRHAPLFSNSFYALYILEVYFIGYLASVITSRKRFQFLVCFILVFLSFLIASTIEKSIVDYTTIILFGLFSLLGGLGSFLIAIDTTKQKKDLEVSDGSKKS